MGIGQNKNPKREDVIKVAEAMKIPVAWFYDGQPGPPPTPTFQVDARSVREELKPYYSGPVFGGIQPKPSVRIKVYGAISAGPDGNTASIDPDEHDLPSDFGRDDYGALFVTGDSMVPFLESGDITIFRDWTNPKPGFVFAAVLDDGTWVCKLLVQERGELILRSLNPEVEDIRGGFRLAGFLVGIVRDTGSQRMILLNPYGLRP